MLQELLTEPLSEMVLLILHLACTDSAGATWNEAQHMLADLRGIAPTDDRAHLGPSGDRPYGPRRPGHGPLAVRPGRLVRRGREQPGPAPVGQHRPGARLARGAGSLRRTKAVPLMTLHKSKGLEFTP